MKTIKYKDTRYNVTSIIKYYIEELQFYVRTHPSQPVSPPKDLKDFTIYIHVDDDVHSIGFYDLEKAKQALSRIDNFLHYDDRSFLDLDESHEKIETVFCGANPIKPISPEQQQHQIKEKQNDNERSRRIQAEYRHI